MFRYGFVLYLFFISVTVSAVEVADLYVAKTVVASQKSIDRKAALKSALSSVFIKVGGQPDVVKNAQVKAAIKQYQQYLLNYRYERIDNELFLHASFNENKINQFFIQNDLAIWGKLRPQILLWFIKEEGLERSILSDSDTNEIINVINSFSERRGLPIALPLMDIEDHESISNVDVWGRFQAQLQHASSRYSAESIVVIRSSNNSLLVQDTNKEECHTLCVEPLALDWSLFDYNQVSGTGLQSEVAQGHLENELVLSALNNLADEIYNRYALTTNENNEYIIDVANVKTMQEFIAITKFLQELASVQSVSLIHANGQTRRFKLSLIGSANTFMASLKLNNLLWRVFDPLAPPKPGDIPVFNWSKS